MAKEMVISASPHETRVAIVEEGQLCEFYVEREKEFALVGSIYKGRVTRVLPGMQSAFVDIGLDGDAFLYVTDFLEEVEELDRVVSTVEDKVEKMEEQGGPIFAANGASTPAEPADVEPSAQAPFETEGAQPADAAADSTEEQPSEAAPADHAAGPERSRYENPRRGGSGAPESYGRGGRGRGGRRGRQDRRFGRELPPSKYTSPHGSQPGRSAEHSRGGSAQDYSAPPEGHTPVILPGESLAKYRSQPPAAPGAAEIAPAERRESREPRSAPEPPREQAPHHQGNRFAAPIASSGLDPLPGESISKWRRAEPEPHDATPRPAEEGTDEIARFPGVHEPEHAERGSLPIAAEPEAHEQETYGTETDLSEEEASALAAHVAEIQDEARSLANGDEQAEIAALDADSEAEREAADEFEESGEEESAGEESAAETLEPEHESEAESAHGLESGPDLSAEHADPAAPGLEAAADAAHERALEQQPAQPWRAEVRHDFRARLQHPARQGRDRDRGRGRDRRGGRPRHGSRPGPAHAHHRPRRPQLIADLLKQGQEIIVQIAKEPLGKKGARITSHVALPGRFLVYMPTLDHTGVSRRIASADDRARLRHLVNEAKGTASGGFIVRTAAAAASNDEVRADVEFLTRAWTEIKGRAEQRKAPSLLHRDLNLVERILRDYLSPEFAAVWVDNEDEYAKVVEFMNRFQPSLVDRVKLYTKETPVFEEFGIQQEIDKALRPKVWLKSGGYIVINHTEALVAIDVNTGKFVGKGSTRLEDTIVRTNLEAVKEVVRQMRLRDLGGIIVIDFIDMEERRNREKVMAALEDALRADRAPSKVLRFNEFGLVAITRKRTKQALERTLCQPCPYCTGSGMVKSVPTLCYEIQSEARKMAPDMEAASITLRVHPEISKALKTREAGLIEELERWTKKSVIIQADPTLHWEQYDIY